MKWNWLIVPALFAALVAVAYFWAPIRQLGMRASLGPPTPATASASPVPSALQTLADNLDIPWEVQWLPDGSLVTTQRPGTLLQITASGTRTTIQLPTPVTQVSESGLLGLTLHPNFAQNQFLYLYFTLRSSQGTLINRVARYQLANNQLTSETTILDNIPAGNFHDGGRIKFGPDGLLYIATGDAGQENLAQDRTSLAGKILRLRDDGTVPADNPFSNSPMYSYGHRNVQGLAWDNAGNLWATEHGRSGLQSGLDELNLIKPGQNYGWPTTEGDETAPDLTPPVIQSGASETWAPSGAAFLNGSIFFAGLRGETLYEAKLDPPRVGELKRHFTGQFGRLRDVVVGPDSALYILTNNTDGRGEPRSGDDKLIRIDPATLSN